MRGITGSGPRIARRSGAVGKALAVEIGVACMGNLGLISGQKCTLNMDIYGPGLSPTTYMLGGG